MTVARCAPINRDAVNEADDTRKDLNLEALHQEWALFDANLDKLGRKMLGSDGLAAGLAIESTWCQAHLEVAVNDFTPAEADLEKVNDNKGRARCELEQVFFPCDLCELSVLAILHFLHLFGAKDNI